METLAAAVTGEASEDRSTRGVWWVAAGLVTFVLIVWYGWGWHFAAGFASYWMKPPATAASGSSPASAPDLAQLGPAGDLFGAVSALFSALAFAGIGVAAYLQWIQLGDARKAAARQAVEAKVQKQRADSELLRSNEQSARQAFEPLFFKLIELHRSNIESMRLQFSSKDPNQHPFAVALSDLRIGLARTYRIDVTPDSPSGRVDRLRERYLDFYHSNESQLGPYFRTLYRIFKIVQISRLPDAEQAEHANIVRGLLSRDEMLLLMVNCLTQYGANMKVFVELYGLLKHVSQQEGPVFVVDQELARDVFAPTAVMSYLKRLEYWATNGRRPTPVID